MNRTLVAASCAGHRGRGDKKNPEDFSQRFFKKRGFSLPITPECMNHEGETEIRTWYVSPQQWISCLMKMNPTLLCGEGDPQKNLRHFWSAYRMLYPHHMLFTSPECAERDLSRVLPLLIHGDEGRSMKKGKCMVMSIQSALGSTAKPLSRAQCDCRTVLSGNPDLPVYGIGDEPAAYSLASDAHRVLSKQTTNYRGSTYLSRFLLFSLGSWIYEKHPAVLDRLVAQAAADLRRLFYEGLVVGEGATQQSFFVAVIGIKGDLAFHKDVYQLQRSYAHVGTTSTGPICHACHAGDIVRFEDYSENPEWVQSLFATRPWNDEVQPALCNIPAFEAPEELIQLDPFHVVKFGLCRSVVGGVLVYLIRHGFFDYAGSTTNEDDRLQRAHSNFCMFCRAQKRYPSLKSFTRAFLHIKNRMSAPWSATKGSDTMLLLAWLAFFLRLTLGQDPSENQVTMLKSMLKLVEAFRASMKVLHGHNLWLSRRCARRLYVEIMRCLRGYQLVGSRCLSRGYRAFLQKPKNHALHHIAWCLRVGLASGAPYVLNPECFSCEPDEDFIGRVSRLSRKVDVRKQGLRVFGRLFLKVKAVHKRFLKEKQAR